MGPIGCRVTRLFSPTIFMTCLETSHTSSRALFSTSMITGGRRIARTFTDFAGQLAQAFDTCCHCINQTFYLTTGRDNMHWAGFAFLTVDRERSAWPFVWLLSTVATSTLKVIWRSFTAKKTNGEASWCLVFSKAPCGNGAMMCHDVPCVFWWIVSPAS